MGAARTKFAWVSFRISGRFILTAGTFCAVIGSFTAAAAILGPDARFVPVILLFLALFAILFLPLTIVTQPLIERDSIGKYLDEIENRVLEKSFIDGDLEDLRRLKGILVKKQGRYLLILPRLTLLLAEMERIEKARATFFWEAPEGPMH